MPQPKIQIIEMPAAPGSTEWFVYRGDTLVRVCPSIGMAQEIAGGL